MGGSVGIDGAVEARSSPRSDNRSRTEVYAERDLRLSQESWNSFVGEGEGAVLMDTFYGQFKSCVSTR